MRKIVLLVFCVVYSLAGYCQNFDEPKENLRYSLTISNDPAMHRSRG